MAFFLRFAGLLGLVVLLTGCEDPNLGDFIRCEGCVEPSGDDDDEESVWPALLGLDEEGESADVLFVGESADDRAGRSIAGFKDLDGDSRGEIVISSYKNDRSAELTDDPLNADGGRVYVFLSGSLDLEGEGTTSLADADTIISSEIPDGQFGRRMVNAGDINGDGLSDLAIGLHGAGGQEALYIFSGAQLVEGGELLLEDAFLRIWDDQTIANTELGMGFAALGNIDGDQYADLAIGGPRLDRDGETTGGEHGRVWIVPGSEIWDGGDLSVQAVATTTITGDFPSERLGEFLDPVGDVDGTGLTDLVLGLPLRTPPGESVLGQAYLFLDSALTSGDELNADEADTIFTGTVTDGRFGRSVASVGDLDGDGFGEFLISAPTRVRETQANPGAGTVYLFRGSESPPSMMDADDADLEIVGSNSEAFGYAMSGGLDVDLDGLGDVVITANNLANVVTGAGGAYLFTGATLLGSIEDGLLGPSAAAAHFAGTQGNQQLGESVALIPDVNGDRFDEILFGSQGLDVDGGADTGGAYLVLSRYEGPGEGEEE